MLSAWKTQARRLKGLIYTVAFAYRDPRTPWHVRILLACIIGYALSPIDLIPDPIPVLGYLDDLILLPLAIALAVRLIPADIWHDAQSRASASLDDGKTLGRVGAIVIVTFWIAATVLGILLVRTWF